jgi:outer membrane lipoprotein-sorting protein
MFFVILFWAVLLPIWVDCTGISQTLSAATIVKTSERNMRGNTLQGLLSIQIIRPTYSRSMDLKIWAKGDDFAFIQLLAPAREKGITFLRRKKEVWNWIPALERTIKLPPSMMSQSWMGTDFTHDDLVRESSLTRDYEQTIIGEEDIEGRRCWKIQLIPLPEAAVVWGKVILWIDQQDFLQLQSQAYDEEGIMVNTLRSSEIRLIGGRMLPTRVEMTPVDKPGNKTIIQYRELRFDEPLSDDFFSPQHIRLSP